MYAEIIAIGDEITSGQLLDTNSQWLSLRLEELGVRTLYHSTVGDELQPCAEVFRRAIERADIVVATGGLGPTADDLTRDALALAIARPLQLDADSLEYIRSLFARRNRPMPPQNQRQAMFPAGSRVIHNPHGTAPGIELEVSREGRPPCRVFVLPGVPAEMFEMWQSHVVAAIRNLPGPRRVIRRRRIHCFGAGESQIESMLPDLIRRGRQPTVGITASKATITLRIVAEGDSEAGCDAAIEPVVATIRQCLGTLVFGEEDDELQHALLRRLRDRRQTLATVEWATAGMVADWLGHVDNAGGAYRGGLMVSDEATCRSALGIPGEVAGLDSGDEGFVRAMAAACRERFAADYGLAIGPFPNAGATADAPRKVQLALATADGIQTSKISIGLHPALLHIYCAKQALNFVRLAVTFLLLP
jgi:nicotinamide-nucleotide amidase